MVARRLGLAVLVGLVAAVSFLSSGCAYLKNRGNDAVDIFDVGVTVSEKPQFSLYAGFFNVLPVGYSHMDGTLYGLAHRQVGAIPARHRTIGLLHWGQEQLGYQDFEAADPKSPPPYGVGWIGLIKGPPVPKRQIANCPKLLHLGWVGITLNCHFGELADFILGWTTLDIMGDDTAQ